MEQQIEQDERQEDDTESYERPQQVVVGLSGVVYDRHTLLPV